MGRPTRDSTERLNKAQRQLAVDALDYAKRGARRFAWRYPRIEFDEFLSMAYFGLVLAAATFDATRGVAFRTHAHWWIRRYLFQTLRDHARFNGAVTGKSGVITQVLHRVPFNQARLVVDKQRSA